MKSIKDIEHDILKITMEIRNEFPELYKYILEMPMAVPDKGEMAIERENLIDYFESLKELLTNYKVEKNLKNSSG